MKGKALLAVLWSVAVLFGTNAYAQLFAGYDQFCGVPVIVAANSQGASAAVDQLGRPVIYVDPGVMGNWTMSRMFALAHECGHHKLGHSTPQGLWFRNTTAWATSQQELAADCWAAQALANIGDLQDLRQMIVQFSSQGDVPQGPYPVGRQRAAAVAQCAGIVLTPPQPAGFPSGHGMQVCGCWGPNPASVVPESRCASGSVRLSVCPGLFCGPGQLQYAYVCM